jgi:hypothetical protein
MVFIGAGRILWYFGFVFHFILIYEVVKSLKCRRIFFISIADFFRIEQYYISIVLTTVGTHNFSRGRH